MTTAYLSHPVSGLDLEEVRAFARNRRNFLVAQHGWDVVLPTEVRVCADCDGGVDTPTHEHPWSDWMRADIKAMMDCDTIVMCPGWETSHGARLELYIAVSVGLRPVLWADLRLLDMRTGRFL